MTYNYNRFIIDLIKKGDISLIDNINDPSYEELTELVDYQLFRSFKEEWKTDDICLYAFGITWGIIEFGKNDPPDWIFRKNKKFGTTMSIALYMRHHFRNNYSDTLYILRSLNSRSEKMKQSLIMLNPNCIRFVKNPSETVQSIAVKQNAFVFQYIKNPSMKIVFQAIKNNWYVGIIIFTLSLISFKRHCLRLINSLSHIIRKDYHGRFL